MKALMTIVLCVLVSLLGFGQSLNEKPLFFKPIELNDIILFDKDFDVFTDSYQNVTFSMLNEGTKSYFPYNTEQLNEKLFSNITIVENTYKYYDDFFRLCSPLDDGVANTVDSHAGAMLGHILNNFLNNYILKSSEPKKISFRKNKT
jgi:hypothetical protein